MVCSAELETVFRGSAACGKLDISDPTVFHRIQLNRHQAHLTACTVVAPCTAAVAYPPQATMISISDPV